MSLPKIPDITPIISLDREDVANLLIASIALEEIGLSHIINAEGEKIQTVLGKNPSVRRILEINRSVEKTLRNVIKNQILLQFKLEDAIELVRLDEDDCDDEG